MQKVCETLGVHSKHFVHFGRSVGTVKAEMEEMDGQMLKTLGNWNPDMQEDRYLSKLPLEAMRGIILLQEVAALMAQRRTHILFNHTIFEKPEFQNFTTAAKSYAKQAKEPVNAKLDELLPGLQTQISNSHPDLKGVIQALKDSTSTQLGHVATTSQLQSFVNHFQTFKFQTPTALEATVPTPDTAIAAPATPPAAPPIIYSIDSNHNSMHSIWNQWNRLGEYEGGTHPPSGFKQLKKATKKAWHASFSSAENKQLGCMNYLVKFIDGKIAEGMLEFDAV
ncbi:hypothetical protein HDU77_000549 [Chytriomyces hyalinus]|nr:hypothetical protein HDU77_000549 [Chytriomyces hyalinus]